MKTFKLDYDLGVKEEDKITRIVDYELRRDKYAV